MHAYRENATSRVFGQSNDQFVEMILKKFFLDQVENRIERVLMIRCQGGCNSLGRSPPEDVNLLDLLQGGVRGNGKGELPAFR